MKLAVSLASLDSLEGFILAVDLGHDVPQQLGLLLTESRQRQQTLSHGGVPPPAVKQGRTCTERRLREQPWAPVWQTGLDR